MNVQALRIMTVTPTHSVATLKGPTSVVALVDMWVMIKTAQVDIYDLFYAIYLQLERKLFEATFTTTVPLMISDWQ